MDETYFNSLLRIVDPLSIVSVPRLRGTFHLLRLAMLTVPGDVVETGVYTGGSGILMARMLQEWDFCGNRRYWGFDSFEGLPDPVDADAAGGGKVGTRGRFSSGRDQTEANFKIGGVNMSSGLVVLTAGWFKDTLPLAPVRHIAFLRLDGDLFVSTWDALINLYDKVVPGGLIYVDDYGTFNGCRMAIDTFRAERGITAPLYWIKEDKGSVEAVWWRKPHTHGGGGHGSGHGNGLRSWRP